jgi:transporter family protein
VLIRTGVVIVIAAAIVLARGEHAALKDVKGTAWLALVLSGAATGISWLAYFKALQLAPASAVAPVDKLSLAVTIVLATIFLGEALTWRTAAGVILMVAGAILATRS